MILISSLVLNISDEGSAIAATGIYGDDKKTYINIGSGNVFKLYWEAPILIDDLISRYDLVIKRHDTALNVYYDVFNKNIGRVTEFYVKSSLLPVLPEQYKLSIYLVAYGKQGSVITSNVVTPYVSRGSGTYVQVNEGYKQPVMKRALAFTYPTEVLADADGNVLVNSEEQTVHALDNYVEKTEFALLDREGYSLADNQGEDLRVEATRVLKNVNGWTVIQDGYTRDANGNWHDIDISYEVLTHEVDGVNEIVTDNTGEPIYVL